MFRHHISRIRRYFQKRGRLSSISIILLYTVAIASITYGVLLSDEWRSSYVSTTFLISLVILPIFAISAAFAVQLLTILSDSQDRDERRSYESRFLNALENLLYGTHWQRLFLEHLIEEWLLNINNLNRGLLSIHHNYWKVCSQLYELTHYKVDCTSSIPLSLWDKDLAEHDIELLRYYESQKTLLINRGITVTRTFILPVDRDSNYDEKFKNIALSQLYDGFILFFIDLKDVEEHLWTLLSSDLALIDDRILLLATQREYMQMVYYYDFYNLDEAERNSYIFEPIMNLFDAFTNIYTNGDPLPLFRRHRIPLYKYYGLTPDEQERANKYKNKYRKLVYKNEK